MRKPVGVLINNLNRLMEREENESELQLLKTPQSRESERQQKLSTIQETNQSREKEDEANSSVEHCGMEFDVEDKDELTEKIELLALALDLRSSGFLYLKEMVARSVG